MNHIVSQVSSLEELNGVLKNISYTIISGITDSEVPDFDLFLEKPASREYGDWTTNVALRLAGSLALDRVVLASALAAAYKTLSEVDSAVVAGPGFINITVSSTFAANVASKILDMEDAYGRNDSLSGQTINLEFVSANPTGPLHIGHTRWAALGDSIARLLKASGADVTTEFYINDAGKQMEAFGKSVLAAAKGKSTPKGGYPGAYIQKLGKKVLAANPTLLTLPKKKALRITTEVGYKLQLRAIQKSLEKFNVHFDVWFSERDLHQVSPVTGATAVGEAISLLDKAGHIFYDEDAVFVRTSVFGDDQDRVIQKSDGEYTYFAGDAAYYLNKSGRGFEHKIYLLGADHHGYIQRLKALASAAGENPDNVEVLLGQLVNINGAKLSKRSGNIIELDALQKWLGTDALRYSLARSSANSPLTLDPNILLQKTNDNPVFYVQYAHARTYNVNEKAVTAGIDQSNFDGNTLTEVTEKHLLGLLAEFPQLVAHAANLREPHRVARYLEELASAYHSWYSVCRVIPVAGEPTTTTNSSRLVLNNAVGVVLKNGLNLLGVSAPNQMWS